MIWYKEKNDGIVISTRIRLARNIDKLPFPAYLEDKSKVTAQIREAVKGNKEIGEKFQFLDLDNATQLNRLSLEEEHLISPEMLEGKNKSVLLSKDNTVSVMLMEEDHIRLQVIYGGMKLDEAYAEASKIDDIIEQSVDYAYDEEFGYLTACPTNAGTGMRASVMMHLPGLTYTKNINRIIGSATGLGIEVRGLYGEGTEADGNLYQISNRITMGLSEKEIIEKLRNVVNQIVEAEQKARKILDKNSNDALEDKVWRSYGILKYARKISSAEAKALLSDVMLGENMGIINTKGNMEPLECMIKSTPSMISGGENMTPDKRDTERAEMLRKNI